MTEKQKKSFSRPTNMLNELLPPQNKEVEQAVLGAILLEADAYDKVSSIITSETFYVEANQKIFRGMQNLAKSNRPIDLLTLTEELNRTGDLEEIGGPYYLVKLTNGVVSSVNLENHAYILSEKYMLRQLVKLGNELITDSMSGRTDVFEILDFAERSLTELTNYSSSSSIKPISSVVMEALNKIGEWRNNKSTLTGVPSGFADLDRATRGWQNGDLIIIAARPSGGKTALALNLIRNAAMNKDKKTAVAVWSLEMRAIYLVLRMLAAESDIILHKLQTGRLSDSEMKDLIYTAGDKLSMSNIFFDDTSVINIRSLKSKARRLKKKNNLGMIVIDYLQLMQGDSNKGNREQEISYISRELKNLAVELDIPIIALSQLSREGVKNVSYEVGPPPSALRESGALEQDADLILMLWGANEQELAEDASLEGKRKLRIVKQRNGVLLTIELDFQSEIQLFKNIKNPF